MVLKIQALPLFVSLSVVLKIQNSLSHLMPLHFGTQKNDNILLCCDIMPDICIIVYYGCPELFGFNGKNMAKIS